VTYLIRRLLAEDAPAAYRLGAVAFGYADETPPTMPEPGAPPPAGRHSWGAFDPDGRLIAKAVDVEHHNWYGGRLVPACGVAGVAVAVEMRGQRVAQDLLTHLLAEARARGAVISTLYGTTPVPYRRLGYEEIGALHTWALPTLALAGLRVPAGLTTRAATGADVPVIADVYRRVARAGKGVKDRRDNPEILGDYHGTSLAIDADGIVQGFCTWDRSGGYGADGVVAVEDLVALTAPALTALLALIGTWAPVAPRLLLSLPPGDPAFALIPATVGVPHARRPWMLRVIDVAGAVAARGWPAYVHGSADLAIDDPVCPWNSGEFRLIIEGGTGRLEPGGTGAIRIGPRGLAALYAGGTTIDAMCRSGLLGAEAVTGNTFLEAVTAGPAPVLRDYF
jgi:predicted acetyltransferase